MRKNLALCLIKDQMIGILIGRRSSLCKGVLKIVRGWVGLVNLLLYSFMLILMKLVRKPLVRKLIMRGLETWEMSLLC